MVEELHELFSDIVRYPVFINKQHYERAWRTLSKKFNSGDRVVRNTILHHMFLFVIKSYEFKTPRDLEYYNSKYKDQDKAIRNVLKSLFELHSSLEGTVKIIKRVSKWRGVDVSKFLLSLLSHFLSRENSEGVMIMKKVLIEAIVEHQEYYGIKALLELLKYFEDNTASFTLFTLKRLKEKTKSKRLLTLLNTIEKDELPQYR